MTEQTITNQPLPPRVPVRKGVVVQVFWAPNATPNERLPFSLAQVPYASWDDCFAALEAGALIPADRLMTQWDESGERGVRRITGRAPLAFDRTAVSRMEPPTWRFTEAEEYAA